MAKGVPILGKDPLGKAKYANVTESGDLRVQLSGIIVVETVEDLPSTGYMAQVALVSEGRRVFIYDGNEWGEW